MNPHINLVPDSNIFKHLRFKKKVLVPDQFVTSQPEVCDLGNAAGQDRSFPSGGWKEPALTAPDDGRKNIKFAFSAFGGCSLPR